MGRFFSLLAVGVIICIVCLLAQAQSSTDSEDQVSSGSHYECPDHLRIAIVDVASLFKNDKRFRKKMDEMKAKVGLAEAALKEEQDAIQAQEQKLKPDVESAFSKITDDSTFTMKSKLNEKIGKQKAEFMQEEGVIYFDTMQQINQAIKHCCDRDKINMVIKVNRDPINPTDRSDILRGINTTIPYYDPSLDITDEVLAELNPQEAK